MQQQLVVYFYGILVQEALLKPLLDPIHKEYSVSLRFIEIKRKQKRYASFF